MNTDPPPNPRSDYHAALERCLATLADEWPATLIAGQRRLPVTLAFTAGWTAAQAASVPAPAKGIVTIGRLPAASIMPGDTVRFLDPVYQYSVKDGGTFRRRSYGGWTYIYDTDNSDGDPVTQALIDRIANDNFVLLRIAQDIIGSPTSGNRFLAVPGYDLVQIQVLENGR